MKSLFLIVSLSLITFSACTKDTPSVIPANPAPVTPVTVTPTTPPTSDSQEFAEGTQIEDAPSVPVVAEAPGTVTTEEKVGATPRMPPQQ